MSGRRKYVLDFITNIIGKNLDIDKTEKFIISLFDLNNREVLDLEKNETYVLRKRLGILDDGKFKSCEEISVDMKRPMLEIQRIELNALKKIKKTLDVSYKSILVSTLGLSVRAFGSLNDKSIDTLGKLLDLSIEELNRLCYMNKQTVLEIVDKVHKMGYLFRDEVDVNVRKDVYFKDEYILSNLDGKREIYNFEYMNNSLFILEKNLESGEKRYIFDEKLLKDFYLDNLIKVGSNFVKVSDDLKNILEKEFKSYIDSIKISKKNKVQNIVKKEFSSDIKYQEDNYDPVVLFYQYLKNKYNDGLVNEFGKYLEFDKFKICGCKEYFELVSFYERVIKFLEIEEYEIRNDKTVFNRDNLEELNRIKKIILEEKNNLLINVSKNYMKYMDDDGIIAVTRNIIDKFLLNTDLLVENNSDVISLSDIFREIDPDMIEEEFYSIFNPIEGNINISFIVKFTDVCSRVCLKEDGSKYTESEIMDYLIDKYVKYTVVVPDSVDSLIDYLNYSYTDMENGRKIKQ